MRWRRGIFCGNDNGVYIAFPDYDTTSGGIFKQSVTKITIEGLPMFVSIIETVILPIAVGFFLNYVWGRKHSRRLQKVMPGNRSARTCLRGRGRNFLSGERTSLLRRRHLCGSAFIMVWDTCLVMEQGKMTGMNTAKKRTISIEVGMQNAGLATNLATTTAQFAKCAAVCSYLYGILCMAFDFRYLNCKDFCDLTESRRRRRKRKKHFGKLKI